jgi:2-desacetyl-2-hydroxyethyl bacteriochlorophyllide A dehydrogenase
LSVRGLQDDGGLADFMLADAATLVPVPDSLSADVAAFAEPTAVAIRALRKAGDLTGTGVWVIGAGTIGQLVVRLAVARGASVVGVSDPDDARRTLAVGGGAEIATLPLDAERAARQIGEGRGPDVVVECSGAPSAPEAAVRMVRAGGTVVLVGFKPTPLSIPWLPTVIGELRVLGSAAHIWDEDTRSAVAFLAGRLIDPLPLLTAVVALQRVVPDGFERLARGDAMKILVAPNGH